MEPSTFHFQIVQPLLDMRGRKVMWKNLQWIQHFMNSEMFSTDVKSLTFTPLGPLRFNICKIFDF
jgi:hypothetical protein